MLSVAEARARILEPLRATPTETVALAEGWGRVLARPVLARLTQPPADVSAMDGYALRAADGVLDARLRVIGAAPAGHPFDGEVGPGEAVRLFTGSVVPHGADCILLQEDATREGDDVLVREACTKGKHIRRAGQDFSAGDALLQPGRRLGARDIGLAAAANHPWLVVHHRPRIAILATGDEIAMPGEPIVPGGIVSSNSHAIAALVRAGGGVPVILPVVPDDQAAIAATVDSLGGIDMLVTTGGASVGEHDLVQAALAERGFQLDFWKIAMRPGKPLIAGRVANTPVLGLPGNPVSALICAALFLLPSLDVLGGLPAAAPRTERAVLGVPVPANDRRADHLRATLTMAPGGLLVATPFPRQDSGMLSLLARADGLVLRAPNAPALPEGAEVEVIRLDSLGL
ncbi:gephyrin-like molybdotransferase Glp [Acidisphaera sp. L21]|uniref:molybdopterin molybdotransferase MoeA n=1 Tax=Acidisphaera sp. L21 TaxID=1641851 RepID=UPI00131EC2F7|nr:gephyrin-like molybdotransferase Glp [Acidisphaera sp. L21]